MGFGFRPLIRASTETDQATAVGTQVTILLAGPVWSLISGVAVLVLPRLPARNAFWRLAVLWFGLVSVQEFAGYLVDGFTEAWPMADGPRPARRRRRIELGEPRAVGNTLSMGTSSGHDRHTGRRPTSLGAPQSSRFGGRVVAYVEACVASAAV